MAQLGPSSVRIPPRISPGLHAFLSIMFMLWPPPSFQGLNCSSPIIFKTQLQSENNWRMRSCSLVSTSLEGVWGWEVRIGCGHSVPDYIPCCRFSNIKTLIFKASSRRPNSTRNKTHHNSRPSGNPCNPLVCDDLVITKMKMETIRHWMVLACCSSNNLSSSKFFQADCWVSCCVLCMADPMYLETPKKGGLLNSGRILCKSSIFRKILES